VSHSLCTLEFENNRELYDWYLDNLDLDGTRPRQYEFARLNVDYTITSKRKLRRLVEGGHVAGWDDPRMPSITGLRRRGVTPEALRHFCDMVGVAKADSRVDVSMLEYAIRGDLNHKAPRVMCVLDPLKVVLTNWPAGEVDELDASYWPHDVPNEGSRPVPFSGELMIERDDFMEEPDKGFFRLAPGREVRLRYGYVIRCEEVVKDDEGNVVELRCTYDPESRGGSPADGRKVKGTIHWVSAAETTASSGCRNRAATVTIWTISTRHRSRLLRRSASPRWRRWSLVAMSSSNASATSLPTRSTHNPGRPSSTAWSRCGMPGRACGRSTTRSTRRQRQRPRTPNQAKKRASARSAPRSRSAPRPARPIRNSKRCSGASAPSTDSFEAAVATGAPASAVAKWTVNQVLGAAADGGVGDLPFDGGALGRLVGMIEHGELPTEAAKKAFAIMAAEGGEAAEIVAAHGLDQHVDSAQIEAIIDEVIAAHPDKVEQFRGGQQGLIGFFMGQVMGAAGSGADPRQVQERLRARLSD